MRYLIFAFALLAFPAYAAPVCKTQDYTTWHAVVEPKNPAPVKRKILSDDERELFIAAYNASPPPSNGQPTKIVLYIHPPFPMSLVVFIDANDCLEHIEEIPLPIAFQLLQGRPVGAREL